MSAENISYDLKRFAVLKGIILQKKLKDLEAQLKLNIHFVNNNPQNCGNC